MAVIDVPDRDVTKMGLQPVQTSLNSHGRLSPELTGDFQPAFSKFLER